MFVLHIDLKAKVGEQQVLEKTYAEKFRPAISAQDGFHAVQLLRSNEDDKNYRLVLSFDHQASQQKWVATDLHQLVWPAVADRCADFSVHGYSTV
jgi:heme-degrading monooxygenase HmoA